jgi:hypothetical protein
MKPSSTFGVYSFVNNHGKEEVADIFQVADHPTPPPGEQSFALNPQRVALQDSFEKKRRELFDPLFPAGSPDRVVWFFCQTAIKNQADRNTCSCFAMVAAIEARYKRDFGIDLDLSEQFFWHMYKSTSLDYPRNYLYENQSSYWGGGNSGGVSSAINFAIPLESDCPYLDQGGMDALRVSIPEAGDLNWQNDPTANTVTQAQVDAFEYSTRYIPDTARQNAKFGIKGYNILPPWGWQFSAGLESYIATGYEIIVDLTLYTKSDPQTGTWEYDPTASGNSHVILLIGYDRNQQVFYFKNSWGGDNFNTISYDCAAKCFTGASIVTEVRDPWAPCLKGRAIGSWFMDLDGRKQKMVIRRYTDEWNHQTRLGHVYQADGTALSVNGTFVDGDRGISMQLQNTDDADPNATTGQHFYIDFFGSDVTKGAGYTTWQETDYGVYVSTYDFTVLPASNFDKERWKGVWQMDHDGWLGTLTVGEIIDLPPFLTAVTGSYQANGGGAPIMFTGYLKNGSPHILQFNIAFAADNIQPFTLHYFTWSRERAAGYTFWAGGRYGAEIYQGIDRIYNPGLRKTRIPH